MNAIRLASSLALVFVTATSAAAQVGYYRMPAVHEDVVVFVAEGDLWKAPLRGGTATRLTTHLAEETNPAISPDGRTVAYTARYEGPAEVYTIPIEGGLPKQHSWDGIGATVVGWTPDGRVLYTTRRYSTLPNNQLVAVDPKTNTSTLIGLAQASDGSYDRPNGTLFFTRLPWQGSHTKRYVGGTAQNIWSWSSLGAGAGAGAAGDEAVPLTSDYPGTSKTPMYWNGRVYFASDRTCARQTATGCEWKPGIMNLWSMKPDGSDVRQHTNHTDYDVQTPSMHAGRIVYQQGADLWLLETGSVDATLAKAANANAPTAPAPAPQKLAITLTTDLEHLRDRWVKTPTMWVTDFHISPTGDRLALVSRGQVFVAPVESGRFVEVGRASGVRFREAKFSPDGRSIYAFSDASGEVEIWRFAANGAGKGEQLTTDAKILRWDFIVSPDGKRIAHWDKNQELFVYDVASKRNTRIAQGRYDGQGDVRWSPDSKWLAYVEAGANQLSRVHLYSVADGRTTTVTSDRYDSYAPTFSSDGAWLYYLSDRTFNSSVGSPWGSRQPEPYFNNQTKLMAVALDPSAKWPFAPKTELDSTRVAQDSTTRIPTITLAGVLTRQYEVPLPAGNYSALNTDGKRLYYVSRDDRNTGGNVRINTLEIGRDTKPEVFIEGVSSYELSGDRKKVLLRRGGDFFVVNAGAKAPAASALNDSKVDLSGWQFALDRREELQSLFVDAWRLERDYFYDPGMHGVDWPAMRRKYEPLAARVTDRAELNDVIAQMVGELSALHIFVRGGDLRAGQDTIVPAGLGAVLEKDEARGGWRIAKIYRTDPDIPAELGPLNRPDVRVSEGDIIVAIDHTPTLSVDHPAQLLAGKAGKQVLLTVRGAGVGAGAGGTRDVVVHPITMSRETDLRYDEWEYTRRLAVDSLSKGRVGYVHLRAMGGGDMADFTREYYPVFNREALIVDVRHNRGGNIDAWLLNRLMRKAWFYWAPRVGEPTWNQHFAFRGPMVTLINENSASDGEAFPEGFRRLGLGKLIGTRTWGGEIWLSQNNFLADRGIATAAETGVYGPEGEWLIEGWGVEPDVVVDNLPRATFLGRDAQLEAAVRAMLAEADARPNPVPRAPRYPRK